MIKKILIGLVSYSLLGAAVCVAQSSLEKKSNQTTENSIKVKRWTCPTCTESEQIVLQKLQERTKISDRNSLSTIMGNIKQESDFKSNICEGGARVNYDQCHRGGYGLIQWTTIGRYNNLGKFCKNYGCDPSSLEGQTRYMINENIFQTQLPYFEGSGQTVSYYMNAAYSWLGWGIHGNRTNYSYDYVHKLVYE
jgi:hypothetical protein